jgi:hypothetical protein
MPRLPLQRLNHLTKVIDDLRADSKTTDGQNTPNIPHTSFFSNSSLKQKYRSIISDVFEGSNTLIEDNRDVLLLPPVTISPNRLDVLLTIKIPSKTRGAELSPLADQLVVLQGLWKVFRKAEYMLLSQEADGGEMAIKASKEISEDNLEQELLFLQELGLDPKDYTNQDQSNSASDRDH